MSGKRIFTPARIGWIWRDGDDRGWTALQWWDIEATMVIEIGVGK